MATDNKNKKELTLKQKIFLYFYKSKQYLNYKWHFIKGKVKRFVDSFYFYLIVFGTSVFLLHRVLLWLNITVSNDNLHSLAFADCS